MTTDPHQRGDDGRRHTPPAAPLPATPPGFTGTRRSQEPGGGHAVLKYVCGTVVEIELYDAEGALVQRVRSDEGAMRTTHMQARFIWAASDVEFNTAESEEGDR